MSNQRHQLQGAAKALSVANRYQNIANTAENSPIGKSRSKGKLIGLSYNDLEIRIKGRALIVGIKYSRKDDTYRGIDKDSGDQVERLGTSEFWYKAEESERMMDTVKMYRKLGRRL